MMDFDEIANSCDLFGESSIAINHLTALDEQYSKEDLVQIYNHFLSISQNPDVIMYLIKLADRFRDKSTLSVLTDLLLIRVPLEDKSLEEKFVSVRSMCAKAIANYKDNDTVTTLLYCLNNKTEHYRVRLACADALGKIGNKYAVAPLIEIVQDEDEKSIYLRETAATALGFLGDARAVDSLVGILETKQGIINKFTFLKERVIEALTKIMPADNERVFRALRASLLDESPQVKINAIEALMESDYPKAYETIKDCLRDENLEVQKNALIALYNMKGRDILDEVVSLPTYGHNLKEEAKFMIEEYESDEE